MEIQGNLKFTVQMDQREFSIVTKCLAGVKLSGEEKALAQSMNVLMLEHRIRILQEKLDTAQGALVRANEQDDE